MRCLFVIDRYGYKVNEKKYKKIFNRYYERVDVIYTKYEDAVIREVRKWPVAGNFLLHLLRWMKSFAYSVGIMCKKDIDIIVCLNPIVGIMLGLMNIHHKKIIFAGFLFEEKDNACYYKIRKAVTKLAISRIEKIVVYSNREKEYYKDIYKVKNKFVYVPYGIDYMNQKKYTLQELPQKYLFSGGGSNRDYITLVNAYNSMEKKVPLVIATQEWRLKGINTRQVMVLDDVVNETFGDVLRHSELLVLSLKDTEISAGHMVMMQAMSLGVPILVNDIPAIRDYVDERYVAFYQSGNTQDLQNKISLYWESNESKERAGRAKELYQKQYTSFSFMRRLAKISCEAE